MKQLLKARSYEEPGVGILLNTLFFSTDITFLNFKSRRVANFGKVYKYKGVDHKETNYENTPDVIKKIGEEAAQALKEELGINMNINNCLVNIYSNGDQSMGYHSDDTSQLVDGTGVLIVSVGCARILSFIKKVNKWQLNNIELIIKDHSQIEIVADVSNENQCQVIAIDKQTDVKNVYEKLPNGKYKFLSNAASNESGHDYGGFAFESIYDKKLNQIVEDEFVLTNGSIFYMDDECQKEYEHAILKSLDNSIRISLTFRELK